MRLPARRWMAALAFDRGTFLSSAKKETKKRVTCRAGAAYGLYGHVAYGKKDGGLLFQRLKEKQKGQLLRLSVRRWELAYALIKGIRFFLPRRKKQRSA